MIAFLSTFLRLSWCTFFGAADTPARVSWRRVLVMLLFLPSFLLTQLINWLFLWMDELLFPRYRTIQVMQPVFLVGAPRSGTTMLHRILSNDPQFTTAKSWELWLAPSISQRKLVCALIAIDRLIGGPGARLLHWVEQQAAGDFNEIHAVSLCEPEEDYFMLLPVWGCFILVVAFPFCDQLWKLAQFEQLPEKRRRYLLGFYKRCIQRHLYVHGPEKIYLNKNPSFTSWVGGLAETFPDARFAACVRSPVSVLPSLLSSMAGGHAFFDNDQETGYFQQKFETILDGYYHYIGEQLPALDTPQVIVEMRQLTKELEQTVPQIYQQLGLACSAEFQAFVHDQAEQNRAYRSGHRYTLADLGLQHDQIVARFPYAFDHFGFSREP